MTSLIEFPTHGDDIVYVEIEGEVPPGLVPVADANVAGKSAKTFEEALSSLGPIAKAIFDAINNIAKTPTEVAVELGFKISGTGTLILCSTQVEANFKATLKWVDSPRP